LLPTELRPRTPAGPPPDTRPAGWLPVANPQQEEAGGINSLPLLTNRVAFRLP
jgi:hypothetical protein